MKSKYILNQVGYTPNATKKLVYNGSDNHFQVMRLQDLQLIPVYEGELIPTDAQDFAEEKKVGDFSSVTEPGIYRIGTASGNSRCFIISDTVYDTVERMLAEYCTWQRCGDDLGWNGNCHVGDRICLKNGEERSLRGGHHQSSDLRKWVFGTTLGMIGYLEYALRKTPTWGKQKLDDEIRYSLKYYLNLISDEGYLFDGTWVPEGYHQECHGVGYQNYQRPWERRQYFESPAPEPGQWQGVRMLALAARFYKEKDPQLAQICLDGAKKIYGYMVTHELGDYDLPIYPPLGHDGMTRFYTGYYKGSALRYGGQTMAAIDLYKAEPTEALQNDIVGCLAELTKMQIGGNELCAGCFWEGDRSKRLANNYYYFFTTSVPQAFLDAYLLWPEHKDTAGWMAVMERIAKSETAVCHKNPYNRTAATWHTVGYDAFEKPGCFSFASAIQPVHTVGDAGKVLHGKEELQVEYEYESFCYNLDLLALGVFFHKLGSILKNEEYLALAQRQLDWMLGYNRFDASNVEGVGYNQPHRGIFGEFFPPVPQIPGGVFVGFTDLSFCEEAFGYENEYDIPMVTWMMYLIQVIEKGM